MNPNNTITVLSPHLYVHKSRTMYLQMDVRTLDLTEQSVKSHIAMAQRGAALAQSLTLYKCKSFHFVH